jgi:hypothetical protein
MDRPSLARYHLSSLALTLAVGVVFGVTFFEPAPRRRFVRRLADIRRPRRPAAAGWRSSHGARRAGPAPGGHGRSAERVVPGVAWQVAQQGQVAAGPGAGRELSDQVGGPWGKVPRGKLKMRRNPMASGLCTWPSWSAGPVRAPFGPATAGACASRLPWSLARTGTLRGATQLRTDFTPLPRLFRVTVLAAKRWPWRPVQIEDFVACDWIAGMACIS